MNTRAALTLTGLLWLTGFDAVVRAQAFTADLDTTTADRQSKAPLGRVYVSNGKVRIETRQLPDGFFLVDEEKNTVRFLRPRQRVFMEARRSSPLTQIFVHVDPDDACRQWQVMEHVAGVAVGNAEWRCDRLGPEVVDGRETVKYRILSQQNRRSYRWVDSVRHFPIKVDDEDGTVMALAPVVDAPQQSTLFVLPDDYRKFDPMELLDRIKQSDVWVERPKSGGG